MSVESGMVYQFVENKYDELKDKDGKYYPSLHDKLVFELAAEEFSITPLEAEKKYSEYSKVEAQLVVKKLNRLPKALKKKREMEMLTNIVKNNGDLPYADLEGPATEPIKSGLITLRDEYKTIVESAGSYGWAIPMSINLSRLEPLRDKENKVGEFDAFFIDYYYNKNFELLVKHVNKSKINDVQKGLFNDCVDAYNSEKYLLCINGLMPILEGILSQFGNDPIDVRMMKICRFNMDKTESDKKLINHLVWASCYSFISNLYKKSDFTSAEPTILNRHWILHGRTNTEWGAEDCIRLFNAIYTVSSLLRYI
ncbi:hypothetical protein EDC18_101424 [Natranaerovirga pectinivora]|uniref:Uncharacterized protein n=1 Tax=Natranaerovirga pectinivora TaxID=682400 RepID=A0A4R3MUZ3_9FIRM|nr:hypothetical protein [Natranaerovirga pectinivora]TCT17126.1 hypothetical protein EDC18_101424 [Natranaerovirga pectinivora]